MTLAPRWPRLVIALAGCIALAACQAPTAPTPGTSGAGASAPPHDPVAVEGVRPCRTLSTTRAGEETGGLPALSLPCLTTPGRTNFATLGGKPTLVDLWASWCGPCREEMPVLQAGYAKVAGRVHFVGVDTSDDPAAAADYLPPVGVTYPQLVDADAKLLAYTRVPGLPVTLLLDANGDEVARHVGALTPTDLARLLDQA